MAEQIALLGTFHSMRTRVDGTISITIELPPASMRDFMMMMPSLEIGWPIAISRVLSDKEVEKTEVGRSVDTPLATPEKVQKVGDLARDLRLANLHNNEKWCQALGTDAQYQEWCRKQPCVVTKDGDYVNGERLCEYAHVRRSSSAGTSYKPQYSGVPLKHCAHHLQHTKGELACLHEFRPARVWLVETAKDWFSRKANEMLHMWVWEMLRDACGVESMSNFEPMVLARWATKNEVYYLLPESIRLAAQDGEDDDNY